MVKVIRGSQVRKAKAKELNEWWKRKEAGLAAEVATQMAESWREDVAIMRDLSVIPLRQVKIGVPIEIVRCPDALKKPYNGR